MEHNSSIFGQVSSQAPLPNHCQPPAFAAMLERHSSFCTEVAASLAMGSTLGWCRRGSFSALSTVFTSRLMMDQTQFQSQFRILGFQWICLLTGPNHNSNFNRRRLGTVGLVYTSDGVQEAYRYYSTGGPTRFINCHGNCCHKKAMDVRTHTSEGGDIRLVKE